MKQFIPHIKRAVVANALMMTYFFSVSFFFFFAISTAVFIVVFDKPYQTFSSTMSFSKNGSLADCINKSFKTFGEGSILEQMIFVVLLKVFLDFTWLWPTWFIVFLAVQLYSSWGLLEQFGIVERGKELMRKTHQSLEKAVAMIPRHEQ